MIGQISASSQFRTSSELAPNMFGASSELASVMVRSWSQTGSKPNSITLSSSNQLLTSSEPVSVMGFGCKC